MARVLESFQMDQMVVSLRDDEMFSATGHATLDEDKEFAISFSAVQNSGGTHGQLQWKGVWDFHMKITCVNVYGNTATFAGVITSVKTPSDFFAVGRYLQWTVKDNGEPGQAGPDQIALILWGSASELSCNPLPSGGFENIFSGNIQVK